jgi:hypothetical protein
MKKEIIANILGIMGLLLFINMVIASVAFWIWIVK